MHPLLNLTMIAIGLATALGAVAEARRGEPAVHWTPHLVMALAMVGAHTTVRHRLWIGVVPLVVVAVWAYAKGGRSGRPSADSVDLLSCAILVGVGAALHSAATSPLSHGAAHRTGHQDGSSAPYALAALVALLTTLAWSVARAAIHLRGAAQDVHRRGVVGTRAREPATALPVRLAREAMVPLMAAMVVWG